MNEYPIFFIPRGEIWVTAQYAKDLKILKPTLFPSVGKLVLEKTGTVACLDKSKKIIIIGHIEIDGSISSYQIIQFPHFISPISIAIKKNILILGGENDHTFVNDITSQELLATYDLFLHRWNVIPMPFAILEKNIDDIFVDRDNFFAFLREDNPRFILQYSFVKPDKLALASQWELTANSRYEGVYRSIATEKYLVYESWSISRFGGDSHISVIKRGDYNLSIKIGKEKKVNSNKRNSTARFHNTIIMDEHLVVSCSMDGIGVLALRKINFQKSNGKSFSLTYINPWQKNVIRLIAIPNCIDKIILVFKIKEGQDYIVITHDEIFEEIDTLQIRENHERSNNYSNSLGNDHDKINQEEDTFDALTDGGFGGYDDFLDKGFDLDDLGDMIGR